MAKDKKKTPPPSNKTTVKKLDPLVGKNVKQLFNRESKNAEQNAKLQNKKKADLKAAKKAKPGSVQKMVGKAGAAAATAKIKENKKQNKKIQDKTYDQGTSAQQALAKLYASPEFLSLSQANRDLITATVDSYTPEQLANLKISKKKIAAIEADARNNAKINYKGKVSDYDKTYTETLNEDIGIIKNQIEALKANTTMNADAKNIAIGDLKNALSKAMNEYTVSAQRDNDYLTQQLQNIDDELNTSTTRANEDEVIQLRQLQRSYTTQLRDTQNTMAQNGLAFSGIRFRAEDELADSYDDSVTAAQLVAQRQIEDAQQKAKLADQGLDTTRQDLQDLLTKYGATELDAIRTAESVLGTSATQDIIGSQTGVAGTALKSDLYGNLVGSNTADQQVTSSTKNNSYNTFENKYGTAALDKYFGDAYKADGYTPTGGLTGSSKLSYDQDLAQAKKDKAYDTELGISNALTNALDLKLPSSTS